MAKKLSFGEEIFLEKECNLGEKDEVAIFMCALCGLGTVAGCILCGCEVPIAFGIGAATFAELAQRAMIYLIKNELHIGMLETL